MLENMSSIQQPSRFIPFTNSAQRAQLLPNQVGFSHSQSGSETDVSTSNENLSSEERYVIQHTARQEPQGQETQGQENVSSNRSSLDVSSSSYNTLIIHGAGDEPWTGRLSGLRDHTDNLNNSLSGYGGSPVSDITKNKMGSHSPSPSLAGSKDGNSNRTSLENAPSGRLFDPSVREITDIPDDYLSQSQVLKHLAKEVKVVPNGGNGGSSGTLLEDDEESNTNMRPAIRFVSRKSRSKDKVYGISKLPDYPKWLDIPLSQLSEGLVEKLGLSRSQPDLSRLGSTKPIISVLLPRPKTSGREKKKSRPTDDVWPPAEMVEILIQENSSLKLELEACYQKVAKSQKLEQEVANIHRAHEELVQSSERRERLERAARARLQAEARRLQEANRVLRDQLELLSSRPQQRDPADPSATDSLRKEVGRREVIIAQLISQNKELVAAKERQEIELAAQRATLQEQRTHIDILDTALTNAQGNVVRLEEECRKKQVYVERVGQLQRALASLQQAGERREQTERSLRLQLERELREERAREGNPGEPPAPGGDLLAAELKRKLREREEQIMRLEGEAARWEQRYLEESALRQAAIDAASIPKDAKIAALEKTSQETEKLIAEARSEKIRHMDEVHAAQKKLTDLESKTKDLESKLAEKDAMIRVLQRHAYEKDVTASSSFPSMLGRSPHHTPHPSLHGNSDLGTVLGTSVSREELDPVSTTSVFSTASSVLTSSCSTGISSYAGSDSPSAGKLGSYRAGYGSPSPPRPKYGSVAADNSFDDTQRSLDDQLKELDSQLDSQLLSKRGLCCFPGFSNTGTAPRKGKIPKPLLASVGVGERLFETGWLVPTRYEQGRPEEIMLLEKQGRSSQQQRMPESCGGARSRSGSLPPAPSSLPRPRRATRPPARRLGEYGRLSDGEGRKTPSVPEPEARGRSNIPAPRKLGEYGRLSDGSLRKPVGNLANNKVTRDSATSGSEDSSSQTKLRLLPAPRIRRGSSLTRDAKPASTDSSASGKSVASTGTNRYRIHF